MTARRVTLGRVAGVYGVQGWVKVYSNTRPIDNILKYRRWWLVHGGEYETPVVAGQAQGRGIVAQLCDAQGEPITDRDRAAALIGAEIQVDREAMPKLKRGQYYWNDLLGVNVENLEAVALGTVSDVTSNGAQDVLVVTQGETERLIPFVSPQIVKKVDLQQQKIVCDWQADW